MTPRARGAGQRADELGKEDAVGRSQGRNLDRRYTVLIVSVIVLNVLLVAGAIALMALSESDEESFQKQQFALDTSLFIAEFENKFRRFNRRIRRLRSVVELSNQPHTDAAANKFSHPISYQQWSIYLADLIREDPATAVNLTGWVPKVLLEDRAEFEKFGKLLFWDYFNITEITEDGVVPAVERPVYFPLFFLSPSRAGRNIVDISSEGKREEVMVEAMARDTATLSEPIDLTGGHQGAHLLIPVFDIQKFPALTDRNVSYVCPPSSVTNPLQCDALLGFVTVVLRMDALVRNVADRFLTDTEVILSDMNASSTLTEYKKCNGSGELRRSEVLNIVNRLWRIELTQCYLEKEEYATYKWFILGGAVALTFLVIVSMMLLRTNTRMSLKSDNARRIAEEQRAHEEHHRLLAEQDKIEANAERERAEEISRAKAKFMSNMSHELRTPLNGVIGTIDILHLSLPEEILKEYAEDFDTISNCAEVLLSTINDILDVNKLLTGKVKLHHTYFTLDDVISSCLSTVRTAAEKKNLTLTKNTPETHHVVISDYSRICQILLNFLSNAVKFTPLEGDVSITLTWQGQDVGNKHKEFLANVGENGVSEEDFWEIAETCKKQREVLLELHGMKCHCEQMVLCVEDNGIGIEKEKLTSIFQPFEQADASVTRAYGGTGLGLSICRQLAKLLGGYVWAESTPNVGSRFYLSLPMETVEQSSLSELAKLVPAASLQRQCRKTLSTEVFSSEETTSSAKLTERVMEVPAHRDEKASGSCEPKPRKERKGRGSKPSNGKKVEKFVGKKVLVVEDNLLNQRVFTKYLKNAGIDAVVASNGKLGVEAAMETKFDLILMDCHMPVMDGYTASKSITGNDECINKSTPIVALTADVEASNRQRCEACGMSDFLTKPLQSNTLYSLMRNYM